MAWSSLDCKGGEGGVPFPEESIEGSQAKAQGREAAQKGEKVQTTLIVAVILEEGDVEESHLFYCEHEDHDSPYDFLTKQLEKSLKEHVSLTGGRTYNWGDALDISNEILGRHGIRKLEGLFNPADGILFTQVNRFDHVITVDHDETLAEIWDRELINPIPAGSHCIHCRDGGPTCQCSCHG